MWKSLCIFFLSIFFNLTIIPSLTLILAPFLIWRTFVKNGAPWFASQLDRIVSPKPARDHCAGQCGLLAVTLSGRVDLDTVCDSFHDRILQRRTPAGQLCFPALQQSVSKFGGMLFWECEKDFEIRSHVRLWNADIPSTVVTQESFKTILNEVLNSKFPPEKSPWEIVVVNNTRVSSDPPGIGNKTTIIFHFDHVLGGGVEVMGEKVLKTWFENVGEGESEESSLETELNTGTHCTKMINWRLILKILKLLLFGSYQFLSKFANRPESVDWGAKIGDSSVENLTINVSEPVQMTLINDIRSIYGTSSVSIILGAYAGALRRFMIQHLIKPPHQIICTVQMEEKAIEILGDSNLQLIVPLPLDNDLEPRSPKERIRLLQKRLIRASHSTEPLRNALYKYLIGALPYFLTERLCTWDKRKFSVSGTSLLTVSSPLEKCILCNSEVVAIFPLEKSPVPGLLGPSLLCNSYGGTVQFVLSADSSILPPTLPLKDLNTFIFKELNDLIKLDSALYV